ncbi:hypothetical protein LC593_21705 [Nostoc sp. CHAB 5844]|nr:hypothetical protein [Nostoc sp. CHAB 5844]
MKPNMDTGVGFRSSNASCYNGGNPRNALAPQPTIFLQHLRLDTLEGCVVAQRNAPFGFSSRLRRETLPRALLNHQQFKVR